MRLKEVSPSDCVIISHADHDGFSSSVLLNSYFLVEKGKRAKTLYPTETIHYSQILSHVKNERPKHLIVVDSPVSRFEKLLRQILEHTTILNFDHHDILKIKDASFFDYNPHLRNLNFLNSSGLVWMILKLLKPSYFEDRCWVAGIGAAQDYCLEDNLELFTILMEKGLISDLDLKSLIKSKIMAMAKVARASILIAGEQYTYDCLLNACIQNNPDLLFDQLNARNAFAEYTQEFDLKYSSLSTSPEVHMRRGIKVKFYDLSSSRIAFLGDLCEKEEDKAVYVAYKRGKLSFRALFLPYDVRGLAKYFGGGGANPRAAGARTNLSYKNTIKLVLNFFEQRNLF